MWRDTAGLARSLCPHLHTLRGEQEGKCENGPYLIPYQKKAELTLVAYLPYGEPRC